MTRVDRNGQMTALEKPIVVLSSVRLEVRGA